MNNIHAYNHLFYPEHRRAARFTLAGIKKKKKCNKNYMNSVYKTKSCHKDIATKNAYFFLKNVPQECKQNKLYREPGSACTSKPFPRINAFKQGWVEVMRFGRRTDLKSQTGTPGYTFYYAAPKTTGLFIELKKPLLARTKLHALVKMGWDFGKRTMKKPKAGGHPGDMYIISFILSKVKDKKNFKIELDRLVRLFTSGAHYMNIFGCSFFDFYDFDLIAEARLRGYDSIVLLDEPYNSTSTATEIIHLSTPSTSLYSLSTTPPSTSDATYH